MIQNVLQFFGNIFVEKWLRSYHTYDILNAAL